MGKERKGRNKEGKEIKKGRKEGNWKGGREERKSLNCKLKRTGLILGYW